MRRLISIILVVVFAISSFGGLFSKEYKFRDIALGISYKKAKEEIEKNLKNAGYSTKSTTNYYTDFFILQFDEKVDVAGYDATCALWFSNKDNSPIDKEKPDDAIFNVGMYVINTTKKNETEEAHKSIKEKLIELYGEPTEEEGSYVCWKSKSGKTQIFIDYISSTSIQISYCYNNSNKNGL